MTKRSAFALALTLALTASTVPAAAQTQPQAPAQPKPQARPAQSAVDPLTQDAIKKVEAGDTAGAIRELEGQLSALRGVMPAWRGRELTGDAAELYRELVSVLLSARKPEEATS